MSCEWFKKNLKLKWNLFWFFNRSFLCLQSLDWFTRHRHQSLMALFQASIQLLMSTAIQVSIAKHILTTLTLLIVMVRKFKVLNSQSSSLYKGGLNLKIKVLYSKFPYKTKRSMVFCGWVVFSENSFMKFMMFFAKLLISKNVWWFHKSKLK